MSSQPIVYYSDKEIAAMGYPSRDEFARQLAVLGVALGYPDEYYTKKWPHIPKQYWPQS